MENIMQWMFNHKGIAIAKQIDENNVEIIKYTENNEEYSSFQQYAKDNNYVIIVGGKSNVNKL